MKKKAQVNNQLTLKQVRVVCITCNSNFVIATVLDKDFKVDVCSQCHPFYLGTQKFESKAGRMERFRQLEKKTQTILQQRQKQSQTAKTAKVKSGVQQ